MSDGLKRRDFLKVLGVGSAGSPQQGARLVRSSALIPYVVPAEEIVPGVATMYASTCRECPAGCGIHVETHSGRATKVEGNPVAPHLPREPLRARSGVGTGPLQPGSLPRTRLT